jgi:hypothetical protein
MNDRVEHNTDSQKQREPIDEDRYGIDERTAFAYVKRKPGERLVTSEEILKELEDFP